MGRMYGEDRTCYKVESPRPEKAPVLEDKTGDAAKDGYTSVGPRRPRSADRIMDADEAAEHERMEEMFSDLPHFYPD